MPRGGVVVSHGGGDAALGTSGAAGIRIRFGQDQDLPEGRESHRRTESRNAAANDEVVGREAVIHGALLSYNAMDATRIDVASERRQYTVQIGAGLISTLPALLQAQGLGRSVIVVSCGPVWRLHGQQLEA